MEEKKNEYEKKPISPIAITGGMIGSVVAMVIGSLFGTKGTLFGAAFGSGASATIATVYENTTRKAHARLRALREQDAADAHPEKHLIQGRLAAEPLGREALIRAREKRILLRERNPWKTAGIGLGVMAGCFLVAIATLFTIESATGKTLHSTLTGKAQYGNSFSYSTKTPTAAPVPSSSPPSGSPVSSSSSPAATISANPDPDAAPTPFGGTSSGQTGTSSSSESARPTQSGPTAPAANAGLSSSRTSAP